MSQTTLSDADPDAPLPGPPEPWTGSTMPEPREAPPYLMTAMIGAEPGFAERLLGRLRSDPAAAELAATVAAAARQGAPIIVSGCGTSEHGAQAAAEVWREALPAASRPGSDAPRTARWSKPVAQQAFEAALEPQAGGVFVGISHEGGTWATNLALAAARDAGAHTALVTCGPGSPGAALADIVVATREQDQSWCHTIGYLSPILAALAVAGVLTDRWPDASAVRRLLGRGSEPEPIAATERAASSLGAAQRLIVVASGADRIAARELALKVEEASYLPTVMRDLETVLHGHLPATDRSTGLVLMLADERAVEARFERARQVLAAAEAIGLSCVALLAEPLVRDRRGALGASVVVPLAVDWGTSGTDLSVSPGAAALLATVVPLQLLTERLARLRGTDPDTLRRTEAPYREAGGRHD